MGVTRNVGGRGGARLCRRLPVLALLLGATLKAGPGGGTLTALASGGTTAAIALADGDNPIRIQVIPPNRDSESYFVTVTRGGRNIPLPPRFVQATAGSGKLTLTWTAPVNWGSFTFTARPFNTPGALEFSPPSSV